MAAMPFVLIGGTVLAVVRQERGRGQESPSG